MAFDYICNKSVSSGIFPTRLKYSEIKPLFKKLEILPIPCQYVFSLMNFILNNQEYFQTNASIHSIDTRNKHHLHRQNANLSCFKKSIFYAGIGIFNRLPPRLISLKNEKTKFKVELRKFLNTHSFYSLDEFFYVERWFIVRYVKRL